MRIVQVALRAKFGGPAYDVSQTLRLNAVVRKIIRAMHLIVPNSARIASSSDIVQGLQASTTALN